MFDRILSAVGTAGVAQLVEQLICNQQVGGSSPSTGSITYGKQSSEYGGIPEWPKGTDCKSAGFAFDGSNPSSPTKNVLPIGGAFFYLSPPPLPGPDRRGKQVNWICEKNSSKFLFRVIAHTFDYVKRV